MINNSSMKPPRALHRPTASSLLLPMGSASPNSNPRHTCCWPYKHRHSKSKWRSSPFFLVLLFAVVSNHVAAVKLNSPAKIQRHKSQVNLKQEPREEPDKAANYRPNNVPGPLNNPADYNELAHLERVRRTNNNSGPHSSQNVSKNSGGTNSVRTTPDECPPNRLLQGLLPVEMRTTSQRRAHCDCKARSFGWQVTCHSDTGAGKQASSDTLLIGDPLPNQLHPAFRTPQIQRQQQQMQAAAAAAAAAASASTHSHSSNQPQVARQLFRRSPLNWEPESFSADQPEVSSTDSGLSSSASVHEGFGDEVPSAVTPEGTGLSPGSAGNASRSRDAMVSQPSSASFTMAQPPHQAASINAASPAASSRRLMSEHITQANGNSSYHNNILRHNNHQQQQQQHHLNFQQAVPVLFSVKYMRNNMIEIDCDQAAPQYKPAMFQGFNVNEITSFTFNNCQLPGIQFSVLLHRARSPLSAGRRATSGTAASDMGSGLGTGERQESSSDMLRRKRQSNDNNEPVEYANSTLAGSPSMSESAMLTEPRIRSLTINLNAVVGQRQLISLLTGLDTLEELQLNYLHLNISAYEADLDIGPSSTGPATETQPINTMRSASAHKEDGLPVLMKQPSAQPDISSPTTSFVSSAKPTSPALTTAVVGAPTTTQAPNPTMGLVTTQRSPAPLNQQQETNLTAASSTTSLRNTQQPTTLRRQHFTTTTSTTTTTTQMPTMSSSVPPTTLLATSGPATAVTSTTMTQRSPAATVQVLRPQTTVTQKPAISLGAPRGLLMGQATVTNPTQQQTTTTSTTTVSPKSPNSTPSISTGSSSQTLSATTQQQLATNRVRAQQHPSWISVGPSQSGQSISYTNQNQQQHQLARGAVASQSAQLSPATWFSTTTPITANSRSEILFNSISNNNQPSTSSGLTSSPPSSNSNTNPNTIGNGNTNSNTVWSSTQSAATVSSPISTPFASTLHSNGFGIRTSGSPSSLAASLSVYNSNSNNSPPYRANLPSSPGTFSTGQSIGLRSFATNGNGALSGAGSSTNANTIFNTMQRFNTQPDQFSSTARNLLSSLAAASRRNPQTHGRSAESASLAPAVLESDDDMVGLMEAGGLATSSASSALSDVGNDNFDFEREPTQPAGGVELRRVRRAAAAEEFELSFGELLPNLRVLKLEAFIDLPLQKADSSSSKPKSGVPLDPTADTMTNTASSIFDEAETANAHIRTRAQLLVRLLSRLHKLRTLHMTGNELAFWPERVLHDSQKSLTRLYLISNNIRYLAPRSFSNLTQLEVLDLSSNQIRQLSTDLFKDLTNLRQLRLVRNLLRKLPSRLFALQQPTRAPNSQQQPSASGMSPGASDPPLNRRNHLESVDFSKNRYLTSVPAEMFAPRTSLISLNLTDSRLDDLFAGRSPEALFAALPELVSITLQGNRLREILSTPALFGQNSHLRKLNLSHNQLNILNSLLFNTNASQITELYLGHNHLEQIPAEFLFNLRRLRKLALAHNRISELPPKLFLTNQLIEQIDLSHNQIIQLNTQQSSMIPFGNGANLRYLNLAYNHLNQFNVDIFEVAWSFYTNLQHIDLSHNNLTGQIQMPIFHTITDELHFNLASNQITGVSVDALLHHEQVLERYATYEASGDHHLPAASDPTASGTSTSSQSRPPSVLVRLTGNPIICDCTLEPLVSYSRRVTAATNPTLLANIFANSAGNNKPAGNQEELPASSRYAVLNSVDQGPSSLQHNQLPHQSAPQFTDQQPQPPALFYHFKFNDLNCAKPSHLEGHPLGHISIGDLLCPIKDDALCPTQCQCHYQPAFKTTIVDCNRRGLTRVPHQLTNARNFAHFAPETLTSDRQVVEGVNKVIIRLDGNQLSSIAELANLFTIANEPANPPQSSQRKRRRVNVDQSNQSPDAVPVASSTAILESAEELREGKYPLSCELYLDHNLIDTIPDSFLASLDQVAPSSIQWSEGAPQGALPTLMLEPPIHTKLNNLDSGPPTASATEPSTGSSVASEMNHINPNENLLDDSPSNGNAINGGNGLFGRQPLTTERKAALMETISNNVRLANQLQAQESSRTLQNYDQNQQPQQTKVVIKPALTVLSLRHNRISNVDSQLLERLSKLIKSSNTKIFLGFNPLNCSDNLPHPRTSATGSDYESNQLDGDRAPSVVASPVGDRLLAVSDDASGAYLAESGEDLTVAASSRSLSTNALPGGNLRTLSPLTPIDCPIGQFKTWVTRHQASIGDLEELYCVLNSIDTVKHSNLSSINEGLQPTTSLPISSLSLATPSEHEHPWTGLGSGMYSSAANSSSNSLADASVLFSSRLIDMNMNDLCPNSGSRVVGSLASSGYLSLNNQRLLMSIAMALVLMSLCLLLMLIYFGDTQTILAFIYIHMNSIYSCLRINDSFSSDGDKLYDAFVSYAAEDRDIVMQLISRLERPFSPSSRDIMDNEGNGRINNGNSNGNININSNSYSDLSTMSRSTSRFTLPNATSTMGLTTADSDSRNQPTNGTGIQQPYKLCIHERDWLPGHLISWNIVNSIQNSRRTILILSKDFIKSVWLSVEFHTAYYQMLEDKIDRLIVIVRGELPPKSELDKNLTFLLNTKTYLTWGEKWFWERLHYALPHMSRKQPVKESQLVNSGTSGKLFQEHTLSHSNMNNISELLDGGLSFNNRPAGAKQQDRPLIIMSNIGKDCTSLLSGHGGGAGGHSSSSSDSQASRSPASSSSTLLGLDGGLGTKAASATTTNEHLSGNTTRLTIGSSNVNRHPGSNNQHATMQRSDSPSPPGVTSILLESSANPARVKRATERSQVNYNTEAPSHFDLSEL